MLKTLAQYLQEHNGNHEAALTAMHADLTQQHAATEREAGANIRARTIAQGLQPLAEALNIPLPEPGQRPTQDATTAMQEGVTGALDGLADLEAGLEAWQGIAADAGLDVEAVLAEQDPGKVDGLIDGFLSGLKQAREGGDASAQELAVYKFAHANGLNPEAVLLQKGLEGLTQREVKSTVDGKEVTSKVWGIPGEGDAFTPALDHLKPVLGALKVQPQQPAGTAWVSGQESQGGTSTPSPFAGIGHTTTAAQQPAAVSPFSFQTGGKPA